MPFCVGIGYGGELVSVRLDQCYPLVVDLNNIGFVPAIHGPKDFALLII